MYHGRIEHALRQALSGRDRPDIARAVGWDESNVNRFLSGNNGIPIGKIDKLIDAAGYVLVTTKYLDALMVLCEVGMSCECAKDGGKEKCKGCK